jgi:HEPN domain-containing protein
MYVIMVEEWQEWVRQSAHDLETAEILHETDRCAYAVFLSHLAVEKALKGLFLVKFDADPPKTHDLEYLAERNDLVIPPDLRLFLRTLSKTPILAFYPDHLEVQQRAYDAASTGKLLHKTRVLLDWIDDHLPQTEARC